MLCIFLEESYHEYAITYRSKKRKRMVSFQFAEWKELRGLNIANNKITSFAESLYSLESLAVLDLSGNSIEGMSHLFYFLK